MAENTLKAFGFALLNCLIPLKPPINSLDNVHMWPGPMVQRRQDPGRAGSLACDQDRHRWVSHQKGSELRVYCSQFIFLKFPNNFITEFVFYK